MGAWEGATSAGTFVGPSSDRLRAVKDFPFSARKVQISNFGSDWRIGRRYDFTDLNLSPLIERRRGLQIEIFLSSLLILVHLLCLPLPSTGTSNTLPSGPARVMG